MSINKVLLIGNLGGEPETKFTPAGTIVCRFSVATTEKWKDKQTGEKKEQTEWHRVVCYRRLAEICSNYLHKGSKVFIEGKLTTRSWEDGGIKKHITEIICKEMTMLDSNRGQNSSQPENGLAPGAGRDNGKFLNNDDDIPF